MLLGLTWARAADDQIECFAAGTATLARPSAQSIVSNCTGSNCATQCLCHGVGLLHQLVNLSSKSVVALPALGIASASQPQVNGCGKLPLILDER